MKENGSQCRINEASSNLGWKFVFLFKLYTKCREKKMQTPQTRSFNFTLLNAVSPTSLMYFSKEIVLSGTNKRYRKYLPDLLASHVNTPIFAIIRSTSCESTFFGQYF